MDRDMILRFEAGNQAIDAGGRYDFKIIAAEGFEASDYEFTSSVNAQIDGLTVTGRRTAARELYIEIECPDTERGRVIAFYNPKHTGKLTVTINGRMRWIPYVVRGLKFKQANLYDPLIYQLSITCPQPYFLDMSDFGKNLAATIKDGQPVEVNAVNIDGSNYVKLQDLPKLADVSIGYNGQPTVTTGRAKFSAYDYDYVQTVGKVHHKIRVWEVAPELLRAEAAKTNLDTVQHDYLINAGYSWWTDAAHRQPYSLSVLVSEGKVLANAVPHNQATGCLIVYEDNTVAVKQVADITAEQGVKFAVGGLAICPKVLSAEEGFTGAYADVLRETKRVVMGMNPDKQRVIIAGYDKMSAARGRDVLLELGCTGGITLDGGGSALMREAGKDVLTSDGRYQFGCVWVEM